MLNLNLTCLVAAATLVGAAAPATAETREPQAVAVAKAMHEAMGGLEAWNNSRYVRFDFKVGKPGEWRVDRAHLWDKWEGRYRFESTDGEGKHSVVLFNVNTKEGSAYVDGVQATGDAGAEAIEQAYRAYINDMYWLAMPWKWLDSGVNLAYVGEQDYKGQACDVVELSFEGVGLTPGDVYKGFVSKDSRLMIHWEYMLQSDRSGSWDWQYVETNGVKIAKTHTNEEGGEINMGDVKASGAVDETLFSDPAKSL